MHKTRTATRLRLASDKDQLTPHVDIRHHSPNRKDILARNGTPGKSSRSVLAVEDRPNQPAHHSFSGEALGALRKKLSWIVFHQQVETKASNPRIWDAPLMIYSQDVVAAQSPSPSRPANAHTNYCPGRGDKHCPLGGESRSKMCFNFKTPLVAPGVLETIPSVLDSVLVCSGASWCPENPSGPPWYLRQLNPEGSRFNSP